MMKIYKILYFLLDFTHKIKNIIIYFILEILCRHIYCSKFQCLHYWHDSHNDLS